MSPRQSRANFGAILNNLSAPVTGRKDRDYGNLVMPKTTAQQNRDSTRSKVISDRAVRDVANNFKAYLALEEDRKAARDAERSVSTGTSSAPISVAPRIETLDNSADIQKAIDDLTGGGWDNSIKNVGKDVLGRVGDAISRPLYAAYNANLQGLKALDEGENVVESLDNAAKGAWKGFTGEEKTTPGELIEYATDPNVDRNSSWWERTLFNPGLEAISRPNRKLREDLGENNAISRNINRGLGFLGETIGDPANLVGGKAIGVLADTANMADNVGDVSRATKKATTGTNITYDAIENAYDDIVEAAAKEVPRISNTVLKGGRKHTPTGTVRGGSRTVSQAVSTEMANQMDSALLTSSGRAVGARNAVVQNAVITKAANTAREGLLERFNRLLPDLESGRLAVGSKKYNDLVKSDPIFKAYDDALTDALKADPGTARATAAEVAKNSIESDIKKFISKVEEGLDMSMYNTFALRVGNKAIPIKMLGKGYAKAQDAIAKKTGVKVKAPDAFSYDAQLSTMGGQIVGNARRHGHQNFEERFMYGFDETVQEGGQQVTRHVKGAREVARQYGKDDRIKIGRHLFNNTPIEAVPADLQEGVQFIRDHYARIDKAEIEAGVRSAAAPKVENYQYLHMSPGIKPGSKKNFENFQEFKAAFKDEAEAYGKFLTSPEEMASRGFKVTTDPFESLAQRQLKSERAKSISEVTDAFFRTYGVSGKDLTSKQIDEMNLVPIIGPGKHVDDAVTSSQGFKVNRQLQNYVTKTGETLYLPKDAAEAFAAYNRLAKINFSDELNGYLRLYDKALNFFKMTATIPFPGFHVKNMAGDIFMGYMDGVRAADYTRWTRAQRTGNVKLAKSGVDMTTEEFDDLFMRYGSSGGFVESELLPSTNLADGGVRGISRRTGEKVKRISGAREDMGRSIHFMHALDEELAAKGIKEIDGKVRNSKAFQSAVNNATFRINKYKFDYGALTKTEKTVLRRTIPFYTFLRKSTPLMLEGLLMSPSQFGKLHRFFDGEDSLSSQAAQWQRELGFANPFGGDEPLLFPSNIVPTDFFTSWMKDPTSASNFADNFVNSMSPIPKAGIELATGRSTFTGQELFPDGEPSTLDTGKYFFDNLFPLGKAAEEQIVQPGLQAVGLRDNSESEAMNLREDPMEWLFGSRFGLGLGGRRLTMDDQRNNARSDIGGLKEELGKMSLSLQPYGIKIFVSERNDGMSVKVRSLDGKKTIYDGDLQGAIAAAQEYTKNPSNKVNPNDEYVKYVDSDEGVIRTGARRDTSPLDRILTPR